MGVIMEEARRNWAIQKIHSMGMMSFPMTCGFITESGPGVEKKRCPIRGRKPGRGYRRSVHLDGFPAAAAALRAAEEGVSAPGTAIALLLLFHPPLGPSSRRAGTERSITFLPTGKEMGSQHCSFQVIGVVDQTGEAIM
jgi:hypothetical protein